jgi:hypothetical protein
MKKIILLLTLLSLQLFATCLHIGFQSGLTCSEDELIIDDINLNFATQMRVSDNNLVVLDIPIYIYSNKRKNRRTKRVKLLLNESQTLSNGLETINTKFFIVKRNKERELALGNPIRIIGKKGRRLNGLKRIAWLRIKVNTLSDMQMAGTYTLKKTLQAVFKGQRSATASLTARGEVEQVTTVGFENVSNYKNQQLFKDVSIDYGVFSLNNINRQIRDIYVKNNSNSACQISFSTSPLISQLDPSYKINMNYFYKKEGEQEQQIINAEPFTLVVGKHNGSKVGSMKFETEKLNSSLIAGEYKAVIQVTVSAN